MFDLVIALPKGRLLAPVLDFLKETEIISSDFQIDIESRKLFFKDIYSGNTLLLTKPKDVPLYVDRGIAKIGLTGQDVIQEYHKTLPELLDLDIGHCKMVLAVPQGSKVKSISDIKQKSKVATSYPIITEKYFQSLGLQVEIVTLDGSVEIAPLVGLADLIVDITLTGKTLEKNGLVPITEVMTSSVKMITNGSSSTGQYSKLVELMSTKKLVCK